MKFLALVVTVLFAAICVKGKDNGCIRGFAPGGFLNYTTRVRWKIKPKDGDSALAGSGTNFKTKERKVELQYVFNFFPGIKQPTAKVFSAAKCCVKFKNAKSCQIKFSCDSYAEDTGPERSKLCVRKGCETKYVSVICKKKNNGKTMKIFDFNCDICVVAF